MGLFNVFVAFSAAIGGLLFGYEIGVISQVLSMNSFGLYFGMKEIAANGAIQVLEDQTALVNALITSTFLIGATIGAAVVSIMADALGRKWSIFIGSAFFTIGGIVQALSGSIQVFYGSRVISGFGVGIMSMVVPLYISETAETNVRGRMVAVQQLMITVGILIASVINAIIIKTVDNSLDLEWRLALGIQSIPGGLLMVIMLFMPYSPRWLANQSRDSQALHTIARLRDEDMTANIVQSEFREIKESIQLERQTGSSSWSELLKKGIFRRVILSIILQFWQQWTGINAILYYQTELFVRMGFDPEAASIPFTIANNFINCVATLPGLYLIERLGRRKLLIYGGIGMGFSQLFAFIFIDRSQSAPALAWGAIFAIYGFIISFAISWGPVVWVYQSEIFPLRVRAKGTGLATMSNWINNTAVAFLVPFLSARIDYFLYLIFAVTGICMGTFVYFYVPETMGKSLEDMDDLFGSGRMIDEPSLEAPNDKKH